MPARETRELLTVPQVCLILGVTANNLRQITHRGALKPIKKKQGRLKQYVKSDVMAYKEYRDQKHKVIAITKLVVK